MNIDLFLAVSVMKAPALVVYLIPEELLGCHIPGFSVGSSLDGTLGSSARQLDITQSINIQEK